MKKAALRSLMRTRLAALSEAEKAAASAQIVTSLSDALRDEEGPIGLFAALQTEPDLLSLLAENGKTFCLPRVSGGEMTFHAVTHRNELIPGAFGILEPAATAASVVPGLIVCPGFAFTRSGARLGKGGGFYDRYLAKHPARTIGVCFSCQVVEDLPCEPHDQAVEALIDA